MFRGSDTRYATCASTGMNICEHRWDSQYEEVLYHADYIRLLPKFFDERQGKSDSEILPKITALLNDSVKVCSRGPCYCRCFSSQVIQAQIKFVRLYLHDLFSYIKALQKESGGILDIMGIFDELKTLWQKVVNGELLEALQKSLAKLPASTAKTCVTCFKGCGAALVHKVDALFTKTVKAQAVKCASCLLGFSPASLQTTRMPTTENVRAAMPSVSAEEWEKYITLPAQVPPPSTTLGCVEWWKTRAGDFPTLAPIAKAFLLTPRSAALSERTFSLLGHSQATESVQMNAHFLFWTMLPDPYRRMTVCTCPTLH